VIEFLVDLLDSHRVNIAEVLVKRTDEVSCLDVFLDILLAQLKLHGRLADRNLPLIYLLLLLL